jgi:hypothetical protein
MYPLLGDGFTAYNWDWFTDEDSEPFEQTYQQQRALIGVPYILPDPYVEHLFSICVSC